MIMPFSEIISSKVESLISIFNKSILKQWFFSLVILCDKRFSGHCMHKFVLENRVTVVLGTSSPQPEKTNPLNTLLKLALRA